MKKVVYSIVLLLLITGTFAFRLVRHYNDILKELQIAASDANGDIFNNFEDGTMNFPSSSMIKKLAVGKRAEAVKELGDYIRKYVESPEFNQRYLAARESAKPAENLTYEQRVKRRMDNINKEKKGYEQELKKAGSQIEKNIIKDQIKQLDNELESLTDPKHPAYQAMKMAIEMEDMGKSSPEDWANWEKNYPPAAKELVRRRLNEFLQFTADIDFNARLVEREGRLRFVNPDLEAKDDNWKRCFRCGKETITAARAYAQQWLKDLK
jgi:hypothetical protein